MGNLFLDQLAQEAELTKAQGRNEEQLVAQVSAGVVYDQAKNHIVIIVDEKDEEKYWEELRIHLASVKREFNFQYHIVRPSETYKMKELCDTGGAKLVLVMVTARLLEFDHEIYNTAWPYRQSHGLIVLPVRMQECKFEGSPLAVVQSAPYGGGYYDQWFSQMTGGKTDSFLVNVANGIAKMFGRGETLFKD